MDKNQTSFNYSNIPLGYYDDIASRRRGVRSFWHHLKFKRVIDIFEYDQKTILDIGCFAGTFLGLLSTNNFNKLIGVDILKEQINYANQKYGNEIRKFHLLEDFNNNELFREVKFDVITIIEVIEHLTEQQLAEMITYAYSKLKPNGSLIITTPNYTSAWPLLELILNKVSDVKYEDQHITRFNYFNVFDKLGRIVPRFLEMFQPDFKTTSHLLTPIIASISFSAADRISSAVAPSKWKIPFGALLILKLKRK